MGGKSSQSTQTVSIPPEVLARYNAANARAESAASRPFQQYSTDPSAFVAPLTATQRAGIANTNAAAGIAQPYYGAATGAAFAGAQAVDPGQLDVPQYMNPYLGTVVGNTAALLNQENQQAMSGQTGNAIRQGAFGGDRAGVAAANLARQQKMAFGNTIGGLLQQGYGQALGTAQQQQGVQLGAQQANRQALQQLAASLAGLGAGAQTAGLQGAQAQMVAGQAEQGTEQAGKTALYNQFLQEMSYPYQQAQFLANIAMGTGALSGSTTTGTSSISDRRAKHDVHEIGRTFDDQPIYAFKYNGDDRTQVGLMAQDVEKRHPEAVGLAGGFKTVDYDKATRDAADRGHFAYGGLAGSSEGGVVHMGHMGEGYAGGGMIEPMGYGSSPFIGYDPSAAFQSLYGGLLGLGRGGMGGEGGVGGIGIPTTSGGHGELAVAKLEQPQMPDAGTQAKNWSEAATGFYGLGKAIAGGKEPADQDSGEDAPNYGYTVRNAARGGVIGGMRHGYATSGSIPYAAAAESIIPDEKPEDRKLLQADPSKMPKPSGGGLGGVLGGLGKLAMFVPGVGTAIGTGLSGAGEISNGLGFAEGGEVGYADGGVPPHDEKSAQMLMGLINKNYHSDEEGEETPFPHKLFHPSDIEENFHSAEPEESTTELDGGLGRKRAPTPEHPAAMPMLPSSRSSEPMPEGGLFRKIMHGEGTDKFSNPYDVVYGANPRTGLSPYGNPEGKLSSMPIGAVQDFQRKLIAATRGKVRGLNPDEGTGAVGAYQFTHDTLADLARRIYGPDWKSVPFSPEVQDRLAAELAEMRKGHLEGTWAAFRDEGPAGARLRAQAGYAAGGLAGRKGYAGIDGDSAVTDGMDEAEASYAQPSAPQYQPGKRDPGDLMATQVDNSPEYMEAYNHNEPTNLLPQQKERRRGFLGDILHGGFVGGLVQGKADSWIPLIAGIGASMSGPYRGIVGLGQGLAAGAKTIQGMREFERQKQETGIRQQLATTAAANVPISQQLANARTGEQLAAIHQSVRKYMIQMENLGQGVPTNPEYVALQRLLKQTEDKMQSTMGFSSIPSGFDPNLKISGPIDLTKPYNAQLAAVGLSLTDPPAAAVFEGVANAAREGKILTPAGVVPTPGAAATAAFNAGTVGAAQSAIETNAKTYDQTMENYKFYRDTVRPVLAKIGQIPDTGPGSSQISNLAAAIKVFAQSQGADTSKIKTDDRASVINAAGSILGIEGLNANNPTEAINTILKVIKKRGRVAYNAAAAAYEYEKKYRNPITKSINFNMGDLAGDIIKATGGD